MRDLRLVSEKSDFYISFCEMISLELLIEFELHWQSFLVYESLPTLAIFCHNLSKILLLESIIRVI